MIPDPCPECAGDGRVRTRRTLTVKIPAGVDTGTRIQLAGEGEVGPGGGPAGDLYVEIVERAHPSSPARGDDLHCTLGVPMTAAALGTTLRRSRPRRRPRTVDVRPGTQSGESITLRGLGVPHLRGAAAATSSSHVEVETPTRLDAEQEELLRELAALRGEERPEGRLATPAGASSPGCATPSTAAEPVRPVTAPLFLVDAGGARRVAPGDAVVLDGAEGGTRAVRRLRGGRARLVTDGAARPRTAEVDAARGRPLVARRGQPSTAPQPRPRSWSCRRCAKGDRGELAVETMTEVGVDVVVPWPAARSSASGAARAASRALRRWRATAREAAKQSRRPGCPRSTALGDHAHVAGRLRTRGLARGAARGRDRRRWPGVALPGAGDVVVVVGPEGGIAPEELAGSWRRRRRRLPARPEGAAHVDGRPGRGLAVLSVVAGPLGVTAAGRARGRAT